VDLGMIKTKLGLMLIKLKFLLQITKMMVLSLLQLETLLKHSFISKLIISTLIGVNLTMKSLMIQMELKSV